MADCKAQLDEFWATEFPDCTPLASALRRAYPARWVRFHSLPGSKRYAENEAEYQTILARHNTVLDELTAGTPHIVLITTAYPDNEGSVDREPIDPAAQPWCVVPPESGDGDGWHRFACMRTWTPGIFDGLLRRVADWELADVMLISMERRFVYHPYDGGADVLLPTVHDRDALKNAHRDWLSDHPRGL